MKPTNYETYLKSAAWKIVREQALYRAGQRCQVCNSEFRLQCHHRTYERFGRENIEDITVLCHECHGLFHARVDPRAAPATADWQNPMPPSRQLLDLIRQQDKSATKEEVK